MRHPKRTITRDIRTRRPLHPARDADELEALTWPEGIRVRDRMSRAVVTIHGDARVHRAVDLMKSKRIRHLPGIDENGRLAGIVTDRDLRQAIFNPRLYEGRVAAAISLKDITVGDVMTSAVVATRPEQAIREAARLMHERRIGALPVVDHDKVVGILTETDVLKAYEDVLTEGGLAKPYRWGFGYR